MKIAFIILSLKNSGGMERVMSQNITYFASRKKDELHLIMYGPGCKDFFFEVPKTVFVHTIDSDYNDTHRLLYACKAMLFIRRTIMNIKPDTILSFGEIWNNFVLLSLLGTKKNIYISDRCRPNKSFGKLHDTLRKWLYPKSTGIIAQTQKAKEIYLTQFHHDNIVVIGNPIRQIGDRGIKRGNIVVSVGRLIDTKNFDQLIEIFAAIDAPDWKLVIVGGDALKQKNSIVLQEQINRLGLQERVILTGQQSDVESYLLRAKIFAFTSSSEGFPNVIGEAMSAGLPVVAYDCVAGPSDMIEDGMNGYLIPLFDKEKFTCKLRELMFDEESVERMGRYASQSIQRFNVNQVTEDYYHVITNTMVNE